MGIGGIDEDDSEHIWMSLSNQVLELEQHKLEWVEVITDIAVGF